MSNISERTTHALTSWISNWDIYTRHEEIRLRKFWFISCNISNMKIQNVENFEENKVWSHRVNSRIDSINDFEKPRTWTFMYWIIKNCGDSLENKSGELKQIWFIVPNMRNNNFCTMMLCLFISPVKCKVSLHSTVLLNNTSHWNLCFAISHLRNMAEGIQTMCSIVRTATAM